MKTAMQQQHDSDWFGPATSNSRHLEVRNAIIEYPRAKESFSRIVVAGVDAWELRSALAMVAEALGLQRKKQRWITATELRRLPSPVRRIADQIKRANHHFNLVDPVFPKNDGHGKSLEEIYERYYGLLPRLLGFYAQYIEENRFASWKSWQQDTAASYQAALLFLIRLVRFSTTRPHYSSLSTLLIAVTGKQSLTPEQLKVFYKRQNPRRPVRWPAPEKQNRPGRR